MKERERIVVTRCPHRFAVCLARLPRSPLAALCGQRSWGGLRHRWRRAHARPARLSARKAHSFSQRSDHTARFVAVMANGARLRGHLRPFAGDHSHRPQVR